MTGRGRDPGLGGKNNPDPPGGSKKPDALLFSARGWTGMGPGELLGRFRAMASGRREVRALFARSR
jgi:hypothetical protein